MKMVEYGFFFNFFSFLPDPCFPGWSTVVFQSIRTGVRRVTPLSECTLSDGPLVTLWQCKKFRTVKALNGTLPRRALEKFFDLGDPFGRALCDPVTSEILRTFLGLWTVTVRTDWNTTVCMTTFFPVCTGTQHVWLLFSSHSSSLQRKISQTLPVTPFIQT